MRHRVKGWRYCLVRPAVLALCDALDINIKEQSETLQKFYTLSAEHQHLVGEHAKLEAQHEHAKKGTHVLLGFIHNAHRLGQPIEAGSAREVLNRQ